MWYPVTASRVGRRHVEHTLAGSHRGIRVVVKRSGPVRPLNGEDVVVGDVAPDQQALSVALDVVSHVPRRMPEARHRANAGRHLALGLHERRLLAERHGHLHELLAIGLARLAHVLALAPEVELGLAENIARVGEGRLVAGHQTADVVRMAMGDDDHVDLLRLVARLVHQLRQPAHRGVSSLAVAGVEQHELAAGVDDGVDVGLLVVVARHAVGLRQLLDRCGRLIAAERRMRRPLHDAVEDVGDLEGAELEAVDFRPQHAVHRRGGLDGRGNRAERRQRCGRSRELENVTTIDPVTMRRHGCPPWCAEPTQDVTGRPRLRANLCCIAPKCAGETPADISLPNATLPGNSPSIQQPDIVGGPARDYLLNDSKRHWRGFSCRGRLVGGASRECRSITSRSTTNTTSAKSRIFVTGYQALVRMTLMQQERDRRAGLNTAGYVTGYRGSPLGGLDYQFQRAAKHLAKHNVLFQAGPQRGPGRDRAVGLPAGRAARRGQVRRRVRHLVRQGAGRRPHRRRVPPCQLRRHLASMAAFSR